jgi:hypothetical protein
MKKSLFLGVLDVARSSQLGDALKFKTLQNRTAGEFVCEQ